MTKISKNRKEGLSKFDIEKEYSVLDAATIVKQNSTEKFDASVDLAVKLGVDPKQANQMVRGVVSLPHGTGKTLSSAIATYLSCGKTLKKSCELSIKYVNQAIGSRPGYGKGHGPINHLHTINKKK